VAFVGVFAMADKLDLAPHDHTGKTVIVSNGERVPDMKHGDRLVITDISSDECDQIGGWFDGDDACQDVDF
jgi:hypothetical protein